MNRPTVARIQFTIPELMRIQSALLHTVPQPEDSKIFGKIAGPIIASGNSLPVASTAQQPSHGEADGLTVIESNRMEELYRKAMFAQLDDAEEQELASLANKALGLLMQPENTNPNDVNDISNYD